MPLPALAPLNPVAMDRFTEMAAGGLDAPVACLSLVGGDRRLLTSSYGLPAPVALLLSWSLQKQLPASGSPLLVTDGRGTPLLAQSPPVRDGMVTAYVGSRLVASDGRPVGTMSVRGPEVVFVWERSEERYAAHRMPARWAALRSCARPPAGKGHQ